MKIIFTIENWIACKQPLKRSGACGASGQFDSAWFGFTWFGFAHHNAPQRTDQGLAMANGNKFIVLILSEPLIYVM